MTTTIYPKTDDNSESKQRHADLYGVHFIDKNGKLYPDGKYYLDKEQTILICLYNGLIDSRGNKAEGAAGGWAIQHIDGHTEYWLNGMPFRYDGLPAIISDYGTWEEYFGSPGKLTLIKQDGFQYDLLDRMDY